MNKIKRWPKLHDRNVQIALCVASGFSYRSTAEKYKLSANRVMQIYRVLAAHICCEIFKISWKDAIYNKDWYFHKEIKSLIKEYMNKHVEEVKQ